VPRALGFRRLADWREPLDHIVEETAACGGAPLRVLSRRGGVSRMGKPTGNSPEMAMFVAILRHWQRQTDWPGSAAGAILPGRCASLWDVGK